MIVLDTNVVSEPLRPKPDPGVISWIDGFSKDNLFLSIMTVAELSTGVQLLPEGRRRLDLYEQIEQLVLPLFAGRILIFDLACTRAYAELIARTRKSGFPMSMADACIAATAMANDFILATRETTSFRTAGVKLVNPWTA